MNVPTAQVVQDISLLEQAANALMPKLGKPLYIPEVGKGHFVVARKDSFAVQSLKAVRVVSGLRACARLLGGGFVQEAMTIFRTIDDFLKEIMFLEEAHATGQPVAAHREFVEQFFAVTAKSTREMLADQSNPQFVSKGKVRGSLSRFMEDVDPAGDVAIITN